MEREVILNIKRTFRNRKKIKKEIETIKRMLIFTESFEMFLETFEVFDLSEETVIKKERALLEIYTNGADDNVFMLLFSKN